MSNLTKILLISSCLLSVVNNGSGSKILGIFPIPSKSHYILGESLLRGLAQRGHEVTMISPYKLEKPVNNYTDLIIPGLLEYKDANSKYFSHTVNASMIEKFQKGLEIMSTIYHMTHNNTVVEEMIASGEKYDACIVSLMIAESMLGICKEVHATPIAFSIVGLNSVLTYHTNNPVPYSYVPTAFATLGTTMSFMDRVKNTVAWTLFDGFLKFVIVPYQSYINRLYHPNVPELQDLLNEVDLYLMNSHISTDTPKPLLPNIIPIGGFHLQIMDELPEDVKEFLDKSKNGVIYFSLGSNLKSAELEKHTIEAITNAFAKIDYDVLWKFEEELPNKPKNVFTAKWLPQRPILNHPKVIVFMTHGGLGGTVESIYGAVPMICMPQFADQGKNCAESEVNGYAITVDLQTLTEDQLLATIKEITENPRYKEKISLKSDLYKNQEINPMDKAIFWVEHVIRHKGAKHLKSQAANIPWYQYYLLDVMAFLGGVFFIVIFVFYFVTKLILKLICWTFKKDIKVKTN